MDTLHPLPLAVIIAASRGLLAARQVLVSRSLKKTDKRNTLCVLFVCLDVD